MPTTYERSVGTSSRDYSTLQAAWNDIGTFVGSTNLVSSDANVIFNVYDDSTFTERVNFSGLTTDVTRNVVIRKASGATARPRWEPSSGTGHIFTVLENFVIFEELEIYQYSGANTSDECVRLGNSSEICEGVTLRKCHLRGRTDVSQVDCVYAGNWNLASATNPVLIENCLIQNAQRALIHAQDFDAGSAVTHYWKIINCTLANSANYGFGWWANNAGTVINVTGKNNLTIACTTSSFASTGTSSGSVVTTGSTNNFDEDSNWPGNGSPNPITRTDNTEPGVGNFAIFENLTGFADLHLVDDADNDVADGGIGPASDSDIPTEDFDGVAISGTTCEPGCFQIVELPTPALTSFNTGSFWAAF